MLGASSAFNQARTARSSRRELIDAIGADGTSAAPAVTQLPLSLISDNPGNPRDHLVDLDGTVESVREHGVILPICVATMDAYLRERPERKTEVDPDAEYVVIDGHRRLEAARRAGLAVINVIVDNDRASTDEKLLETAFVANYHRLGMSDLEEAHALKKLVEFYGSQQKVGQRVGLTQSAISSKLSLLKLAPDLQADLVAGVRTTEQVRNLGKLSPEEQRAKADQRAQASRRKAEPKQEPAPSRREPAPAAEDYHAVIIPEADRSASRPQPTTPAPKPEPAPAALPDQRVTPAHAEPSPGWVSQVPWEAPEDLCREIATHMDGKKRRALIKMLLDLNEAERQAAASR